MNQDNYGKEWVDEEGIRRRYNHRFIPRGALKPRMWKTIEESLNPETSRWEWNGRETPHGDEVSSLEEAAQAMEDLENRGY